MFPKLPRFICALILLAAMLVTGCRSGQTPAPSSGPSALPGKVTSTLAVFPVATTVAPTPTATPEPLALRVNGEGVSLAEYQASLKQLQDALAALGKDQPPEQQRQQVLDDLTDTALLAQGAREAGYQADGTTVQGAIDKLSQQLGGQGALDSWVSQNSYSQAGFRDALSRQLAAAWQRDQLAAGVPADAEQVHARQILTIDEATAQKALNYVRIPGTNFAAYAYQYDPQTGGDLGWFPRGYLTQPEVENAAFALQPGEISEIIKTQVGFHIVQVIAREPSRAISPDALRVLQHKAIQSWLEARREASKIEILLP